MELRKGLEGMYNVGKHVDIRFKLKLKTILNQVMDCFPHIRLSKICDIGSFEWTQVLRMLQDRLPDNFTIYVK